MTNDRNKSGNLQPNGLLSRLARDRSGNTFAMVAAAIAPLLAMVGGGIDMGRSYMSETRLQQACDAGVLAARKRMGANVSPDGNLTAEASDAGNRFFDLNFRDGAYGTENRHFAMTLEADYSVSGVATVDVPTTIMRIFGNENMALQVECEAKLNFSNTDIMFVLDTTGSMTGDGGTNPTTGTPETRMEALQRVVKDFHKQLEDAKGPTTRMRYGFVPYSTNVRVGQLLKSDWMVDQWTYQSRTVKDTGTTTTNDHYTVTYQDMGGTITPVASYQHPACPNDSLNNTYSTTTTVSTSPHEYWYIVTQNGTDYWCSPVDGKYTITGQTFNNKVTKVTYKYANTTTDPVYTYTYQPVTVNVTAVKGASGDDPTHSASIDVIMNKPPSGSAPVASQVWYDGCIEERSTYKINDYGAVDLGQALDLDIDLVPTAGNPDTQWRPQFPDMVFARALGWDGSGSFKDDPIDYDWDYLNPSWAGYAACPAPAQKLEEMDESAVGSYVDALYPAGSTYHDIGMIWGGRLLSPTGLFADENQDVDGKTTSRHLIFLTDGETAPLDISYGTYGLEPLDKRRWSNGNLKNTVESRFSFACEEVKKKGIIVWIIGFGTSLDDFMTSCAGADHTFEAQDSAELADVFSKIAGSIGDLRISK